MLSEHLAGAPPVDPGALRGGQPDGELLHEPRRRRYGRHTPSGSRGGLRGAYLAAVLRLAGASSPLTRCTNVSHLWCGQGSAPSEDIMKIATLTVSAILAGSLLGACGTSGPGTSGPSSTGSASPSANPTLDTTTTASPTPDTTTNGLVAARYSQCDFGSQILKYLATGDNQGISDLDKNFASYVGTTGPRARAIADASIEQCNKQADDAAAAQAAQASASASTSASASAQAVQDQKLSAMEIQSCASIGGKLSSSDTTLCASTVTGDPSGKAGADCGAAYVGLYDGAISQNSYTSTKQFFPGCFR